MKTTASDILIDAIHDWGVDVVFGLPGDGINGVFDALRKLPTDGELLMPGERGARNAARQRDALAIDGDVYAELRALNSDPGS